MSLSSLNKLPDGVEAAGLQIAKIDSCLSHGFARLGDREREGMASLARTFVGTPLAQTVDGAVEQVLAGNVTADHLATIAAARAALSGARHDALEAQALAAVGAAASEAPTAGEPQALSEEQQTLVGSTGQWLQELALAGFGQLEAATVAPFAAVLEELQAQPPLFRLSALLTGFVFELLDHVPTAALDEVPVRRWADIWTRAYLLCTQGFGEAECREVSGMFVPLGVDVRQHDRMVSAVVYGMLQSGDTSQLVRTTVSKWKVDAVAGNEVWGHLRLRAKNLLTALAAGKALEVSGLSLSATGDLIWQDGPAKPTSKKFQPLSAAMDHFAEGKAPAPPRLLPLDRHPTQLAVPLFVSGCKLTLGKNGGRVAFEGTELPLALERVTPHGPTDKALRATKALFGLLRFDDEQWRVQPLTAGGKEGFLPGLAPGIKAARGAGYILKERASKLLRRKC